MKKWLVFKETDRGWEMVTPRGASGRHVENCFHEGETEERVIRALNPPVGYTYRVLEFEGGVTIETRRDPQPPMEYVRVG